MLDLGQVPQGVRGLPELRLKLLLEPVLRGCWVQSLRWTKSGRRELRQR